MTEDEFIKQTYNLAQSFQNKKVTGKGLVLYSWSRAARSLALTHFARPSSWNGPFPTTYSLYVMLKENLWFYKIYRSTSMSHSAPSYHIAQSSCHIAHPHII